MTSGNAQNAARTPAHYPMLLAQHRRLPNEPDAAVEKQVFLKI